LISEHKNTGHQNFPGDRWKGKVSNHTQLGGIETAVLDNGNGKGVRIAWFNTGSGLRFRVILDRGMDIADAFFNQYSLAWISHLGVTPPDVSANKGVQWFHSFGGGLLTTCGLTHVGGPEEDQFGERGVHDRISHSPAEIISIQQPGLNDENKTMSITGRMIQSSTFGPHLELIRTIESELGSSTFNIYDEITNLGNQAAPHMLLYHCNFGWPLIDKGTELHWDGELTIPNEQSHEIFDKDDYNICKNPMDSHSGTGEAVAFIDAVPSKDGYCTCSVKNNSIGLELELKFLKEQLPWLTNWQHWGKNEYVAALEPCTHPPIGQAAARENESLIFLEPGETKKYELEMRVHSLD
jgi:hypothetical protein